MVNEIANVDKKFVKLFDALAEVSWEGLPFEGAWRPRRLHEEGQVGLLESRVNLRWHFGVDAAERA